MAKPIDGDRWFDPASSRGSYGLDAFEDDALADRPHRRSPAAARAGSEPRALPRQHTDSPVTVGEVLARLAQGESAEQAGVLAALMLAIVEHVEVCDDEAITGEQIRALLIGPDGSIVSAACSTAMVPLLRSLRDCVGPIPLAPAMARALSSRLPTTKPALEEVLSKTADFPGLLALIDGRVGRRESVRIDATERPVTPPARRRSVGTIEFDDDDLEPEGGQHAFRRLVPLLALVALVVAFGGSLALNAARDARADEPAVVGTAAMAAPASTEPSSTDAAPSSAPSASSSSGVQARGAIAVPTQSPGLDSDDVLRVIKDLDGQRARAIESRRVENLEAVYTSDAAGAAADRQLIRDLLARGARLVGGRTTIESVTVLQERAAEIRVEVVDIRDAYRIVDARTGDEIAAEPQRPAQRWELILVRDGSSWLISDSRAIDESR